MNNAITDKSIVMEYTGKIKELQGRQALVRRDNAVWKGYTLKDPTIYVLAQFHQGDLVFGGVKMYLGWHHFHENDFTPLGNKPVF